MIKTKSDLKYCLQYEKRNYNIKKISIFLGYFGLSEHGIIWNFQKRLRKYEYFLNNFEASNFRKYKFRTALYKLKVNAIGLKYRLAISPNVFDIGLKITHLGQILTNENARVGKNCVVNIDTALVATNGNNDAPILGDNVKIGIGAKLIGNIKIANGIAIGAGSVVTKSFEQENITIAGVPAKQISSKGIL